MPRVGDDESGFSVDVDAPVGGVQVTAWGFWGVDVARRFVPTVSGACRAAAGHARLSMDMTRLKPLRDEGQDAVGNLFSALSELGIRQVSVSTSSHLTKLQLMRIAKGRAPKTAVEFVSTVGDVANRSDAGGTNAGSR